MVIRDYLEPSVQDELANFKFYQDNPIKKAEEDVLGYRYIVDNLIYILKNSIKTPINIGLYGKWGVGKSSILNLIEERLQQEDDLARKFKFVYIDVWGLSSQSLKQELLLEFYYNVQRKFDLRKAQTNQQITEKDIIERLYYTKQIDEDQKITLKTFVKKAKWYFPLYVLPLGIAAFAYVYDPKNTKNLTTITIIGSLITSVLAPSLFNLVDRFEKKMGIKVTIPKTESSQEFRKIFEEILFKVINKEDNQVLVIAIDNLDRCDDKTVVEMLGMIKTFLNIEGCVFLIACDDDAIIKHITSARMIQNNEYYNDANDFLEKMFQIVLRVPSINEQQLVTFVNYLANTLQIQIDPQVSEILIASKMYNPRKIQRFLNRLTLLLKSAVDEEKIGNITKGLVTRNTQFLSKLLVIREKYFTFYKELLLNNQLLERFERYLTGEEQQSKIVQEIIKKDDLLSSELVYFLRATMGINSPNVSAFLRLFEEKLDKTVSEADILVSESIEKGTDYTKQALENMRSNEYKAIYTRALMNYIDKCVQREDFDAAADCLNIMLNISDKVPQELRKAFLIRIGRYISQSQMSEFINNNVFDIKKIFSLIYQMPYDLDKYIITFLISNLLYNQRFNNSILQGFIDHKEILNNDMYIDKINKKIEQLFLDKKDDDALVAMNTMIKATDIKMMFIRPSLISKMIENIDVNEPKDIMESKAQIFFSTKDILALQIKSLFIKKMADVLKNDYNKKSDVGHVLPVFKWLNRLKTDDYMRDTASYMYDCSMDFYRIAPNYFSKKIIVEPLIILSYHIDEDQRKGLADIILSSIDDNQDFINILEYLKIDDKLKGLYERLSDVHKIFATRKINHDLLAFILKNSAQEKKEKIANFFIDVIQNKEQGKKFRYNVDLECRAFKECYQFFPIAINQGICQAFIKSATDRIQEAITKRKDAIAKLEQSKEEFKDTSIESLTNGHYEKEFPEIFADVLKNTAILSLVSSFYVFDKEDDATKNQILSLIINILTYDKKLSKLHISIRFFIQCIEDKYYDKYDPGRTDHTPVPTTCTDMIIMQLISKLRSELDTVTDEVLTPFDEHGKINDQSNIIYIFEFLAILYEYKKINESNKNLFVNCILGQLSKEKSPAIQRISLSYLTRINLTEKEKENVKNTILKVESEVIDHDIKLMYEQAIKQMK